MQVPHIVIHTQDKGNPRDQHKTKNIPMVDMPLYNFRVFQDTLHCCMLHHTWGNRPPHFVHRVDRNPRYNWVKHIHLDRLHHIQRYNSTVRNDLRNQHRTWGYHTTMNIEAARLLRVCPLQTARPKGR